MKNHCNQCGMCCTVVMFPYSMDQMKKLHSYDAEYVVKNFKQITREEAFKINPRLIDRLRVPALHVRPNDNFYTCNNFVNRKCTDYENRPIFCKQYPFNSISPSHIYKIDSLLDIEECEYAKPEIWSDINDEIESEKEERRRELKELCPFLGELL